MSASGLTTPQDAVPGALRGTGIVKSFSRVTVLKGIDITLTAGRVTGLVGHNGAGKSTLLRVLAGAHAADEGSVVVDGVELPLGSPTAALDAGVSTVYQELSLLPNLTVAQNVFLGRELTRSGQLDRRRMREETRALAERFKLDVDPDRRLADYPVATRQLLEIAIAVARDARYLLLDEPTTSLEGGQVEHFLATVRALSREDQLGILLIDHKLDELYAVADDIVALVDGQVRISGPVDQVDRQAVVEAIAGEEAHVTASGTAEPVDRVQLPDVPAGTRPALAVRDLRGPALNGVTLEAYAGRVLGIYGLIGAGRTELLRSLVGLDRITGGSVELGGAPYRPTGPADAQRRGIVYLTEERKVDGIVGGLDCTTNVVLPVLRRFRRLGLLDKARIRRESAELMERLQVRGNRAGPVERLSGGNQQKVLLARVLAQEPSILLLDEPTKGVDIGVKGEIHRLLRALAHEEGLTVIVVSSEEEEVLELADDVVTLTEGTCDGSTVPAADLTAVALRHAAWSAA
ncbi:sugar ABC transporter ATP-binding protein [Salana multivorans]